MNKMYIKKLLSLLLVVLLVFPALVSASGGTNVTIKSVYFKDEAGNMVFVDYEQANERSMNGNHILYNAIKKYVGIAETKGRHLYLKTNTGKVLDYGKAMADNLFRLQDILDKVKYEVNSEIKYTHELKVVNGVAVIVKIGEIDPPDPIDPVNVVSISSVDDIEVEFGTTLVEAIGLLQSVTTIKDSEGKTHKVELEWNIQNYNGNLEGRYNAVGRFRLPEGIKNGNGLELKVTALVIVKAEEQEPEPGPKWPIQVEDVFIGTSQITNNTYANIEIKDDYVEAVEAVYLDDILAINMEGKPSQWRIEVEVGTTLESLQGKISVKFKEGEVVTGLNVSIDKEEYNIDEDIILKVTALKENLGLEDIDITMKIEGEEGIMLVEQLKTDKNGKVSYIFKMPSDSTAGEYTIVIKGQEPVNETVRINFTITK